MATGENMMDLALRITADPSQAEAAVKQFADNTQAAVNKISEAQGQANATAQQSTKEILASLGIQEDAWKRNAAAARASMEAAKAAGYSTAAATQRVAASMDAVALAENNAVTEGRNLYETAQNVGVRMGTMGEEAQAASGGIYGALTGMRHFRMIFAATIGLASFGFWVNEWGRLAGYLGDAVQKMDDIHTAQNDIVMSQAFQALKQITDEQKKQLLQPHSPHIARIYEEGIKLRLQTLQRLKGEVDALQAGALAGSQYAKALQDIAAHAREFGMQGSYPVLSEKLAKQIQAYRAIVAVEQEYEQSHNKRAKAAREHARAAGTLAKQESDFIFSGKLFGLKVGGEFTRDQVGIAAALGAQRFANLKSALAAYQSFEKAAGSEEARARAESVRKEQEYFRSTEQRMRRHVQTMLALQKEVASGGSFAGVSFKAIGQTFSQFNAGLLRASELSGIAIEPISRLRFELMRVREAADMVGMSFRSFSQDIGRNAAQAIIYNANFGQAMEKATKATLAQIAAQSFIWAMFYTAHGIADIFWNPPRAVADFAAAAEFAAIGAAIPGGGGAARAAGAASRGGVPAQGLGGSPGVVGGEGPLGSSSSGGVHRDIYVQIYGGQITDTHNLQNLVETLNQGGQAGTVRLNIAGSSHTLPNPVY